MKNTPVNEQPSTAKSLFSKGGSIIIPDSVY